MTIPSGIIEALFSAALVLMGWMIKHGFMSINTTLKEISSSLTQAVNRVVQLEEWAKHRERTDDERHHQNQAAIEKLENKIDQRRPRRK